SSSGPVSSSGPLVAWSWCTGWWRQSCTTPVTKASPTATVTAISTTEPTESTPRVYGHGSPPHASHRLGGPRAGPVGSPRAAGGATGLAWRGARGRRGGRAAARARAGGAGGGDPHRHPRAGRGPRGEAVDAAGPRRRALRSTAGGAATGDQPVHALRRHPQGPSPVVERGRTAPGERAPRGLLRGRAARPRRPGRDRHLRRADGGRPGQRRPGHAPARQRRLTGRRPVGPSGVGAQEDHTRQRDRITGGRLHARIAHLQDLQGDLAAGTD